MIIMAEVVRVGSLSRLGRRLFFNVSFFIFITSEGAVFKLTKRYFRQRIDEDGSDFDKITMTHYE